MLENVLYCSFSNTTNNWVYFMIIVLELADYSVEKRKKTLLKQSHLESCWENRIELRLKGEAISTWYSNGELLTLFKI